MFVKKVDIRFVFSMGIYALSKGPYTGFFSVAACPTHTLKLYPYPIYAGNPGYIYPTA